MDEKVLRTGEKLKDKLHRTIRAFGDTLIGLQVNEERFGDARGGLFCPSCQLVHRRCGDALFPLYLLYGTTGEERYRDAARRLLAYVERTQSADGSWDNEFASDWKGTTAFQLLSLCHAHMYLESIGQSAEAELLIETIGKASGYIWDWMSGGKVRTNVNYFITSALVLLLGSRILGEARYAGLAERLMTEHGVANVNAEGFLLGETTGDRWDREAGRVDIGYNLDMSLGAMAEYARITGDERVLAETVRALDAHLAFIYPDGSMDNSFGSRSYKWTLFGSKTAHGCQMALLLLADRNPAYARAAELNLDYLLKACEPAAGAPGNGPHHNAVFGEGPRCVHPVFNRADALAVASHWGRATEERAPLPTERPFGIRSYPSLDVRHVRTPGWMATVSCSQVKNTPTGGSISYLWAPGWGPVQIGSATVYRRHEAINMPPLPAGVPADPTPRVEAEIDGLRYSSLHEYDAVWIDAPPSEAESAGFGVRGKLKRIDGSKVMEGPFTYRLDYSFEERSVTKRYRLDSNEDGAQLRIVEPIAAPPEAEVRQASPGSMTIRRGQESVLVEWDGDAVFAAQPAEKIEQAVAVFPAVCAKRLEWTACRLPAGTYELTVRLTVLSD